MVLRARTKKGGGTVEPARENYSDKENENTKKVIGAGSDQFSFIELLGFTLLLTPITTILGVNGYLLGPRLLEPMMGNFFPHYFFLLVIGLSCAFGGLLGLVFHSKLYLLTSKALGIICVCLVGSSLYVELVTSFSLNLGPYITTHVAYLFPVYLPVFLCCWLNASLLLNNMAFLKQADTPLHSVVLLTAQLAIVVGGLSVFVGGFVTLALHSCHGMINTALVGTVGLIILNFTLLRRWRPSVIDKLVIPVLVMMIGLYIFQKFPRCGPINNDLRLEPEYRTLARRESVTGWVTVAEEERRRVRVLRSGHSILGGIFIDYDESIFGSFYYMEAVQLIKRPPIINSNGNEDNAPFRALQIGLGIGVSAKSLTEAGVLVDIVELDPAVYEFAISYFQLPPPHAIYLEDGHQFLINKANESTYDYILHDVFTGGTVPSALFSQEALLLCKRTLKPNGILALNYVGGVLSPYNTSFALITSTLQSVFSQVRIFTEEFHDPSDLSSLVNLVFFCSDFPIHFQLPTPAQLRNPQSIRAQALNDLLRYEIDLAKFINKPLPPPVTEARNTLNTHQLHSAYQHWYKMKELFPMKFWQNY